jgi:hypothetical protein
MELRYRLVFKSGTKVISTIEGQRDVPAGDLTVAEVVEKVMETEQFIEKLTGYRLHIEQVN